MARGKKVQAEVEQAQEYTDLGVMKAVPYGVDHAEAELETATPTPVTYENGSPTKVSSTIYKLELEPEKPEGGELAGDLTLPYACVVYNKDQQLDIHKIYPSVSTPEHKTQASGCFDLEVYIGPEIKSVRAYNYANQEYELKVQDNNTGRYIALPFGNRALLPTGLVFVVPYGFAVSLLTRSSAGFKKGLQLSQSVGYIDEDYRNEVFIPVTNTAHSAVRIDHKERIAQGHLHPWYRASFNVLHEHPGLATDRIGGIGSTNQ